MFSVHATNTVHNHDQTSQEEKTLQVSVPGAGRKKKKGELCRTPHAHTSLPLAANLHRRRALTS